MKLGGDGVKRGDMLVAVAVGHIGSEDACMMALVPFSLV